MNGRLVRVAAVAAAVGGLYLAGTLSEVLAEPPVGPKMTATLSEKPQKGFVGIVPALRTNHHCRFAEDRAGPRP